MSGRRPLRFLFVMHYPGYFRYFDSAIRELTARGHHVDVAFDDPEKQAEGAEAVAGVVGVDDLGRMPTRGDLWAFIGRAIRQTVDYIRYLHPDFADAPYLRARMKTALPPLFRFFGRWSTASATTTKALVSLFTTSERAIPSSPALERFITSRQPDAVLVTPLVTDGSPQADVVKSAQALGIPAVLCVASWDHLTTKGLIRVRPDLVSVWNEEQKREAVAYHGTDPARIAITGAQPFDRWFERQPTDRTAFCRKVGLAPDKPFVLFVGSTASISAPETELEFVHQWIAAVRREPSLAGVGVLVRPHPYNARHWSQVDFAEAEHAVVYPRTANPVNESDRQDYFDSLHHSAAVVGVNTTAMIEAAIVGRTVHSVLADAFTDTQQGTLHFRYLLAENGGFLRVARSLPEHARQLAETLASPGIGREACERFVRTFIRPHGVGVAATPILADALERLALAGRRAPVRTPLALYPLRWLLWVGGGLAMYGTPGRLSGKIRKRRKIRAKERRKRARAKKLARLALARETGMARRKAG
jgi:hypothetical protein